MNYSITNSNYAGAVEIWASNNAGQSNLVAIVRGNALITAEQAAKNRIDQLEYPYGR